MTRLTKFSQEVTNDLIQNPGVADQIAQQVYGFRTAAELEKTLVAMTEIVRGGTVSDESTAFLVKQAQQNFGWNPQKTRSEIRRVASLPDENSRLAGYLSTGNRSPSQNDFDMARELISHGVRADYQLGVTAKLEERTEQRDRIHDNFNGMTAPDRVVKKSSEAQSLRDRLKMQMGITPDRFVDNEKRRESVMAAREKIADKLDHDRAVYEKEGREPTLRESLAQNYAVAAVSSASEELGMDSPLETVKEQMSDWKHLSDSYESVVNEVLE